LSAGLINLLAADEIEAVLAHEIHHIKHGDTLMMTAAASLSTFILTIVAGLNWVVSLGRTQKPNAVAQILSSIAAPLAALPVRLAASRSREIAADQFAVELTQKPEPLARALWKMQNYINALPKDGTLATAHLFIISPLTNTGIDWLFKTHPKVDDRIKRLIGRSL
jgi:heat shock protein HtpX